MINKLIFIWLKYSGENKYDKCEIINRLLWTKCLDSKCNKESHQIQIPATENFCSNIVIVLSDLVEPGLERESPGLRVRWWTSKWSGVISAPYFCGGVLFVLLSTLFYDGSNTAQMMRQCVGRCFFLCFSPCTLEEDPAGSWDESRRTVTVCKCQSKGPSESSPKANHESRACPALHWYEGEDH